MSEAITSLIEKLEGASEGSRELDWLIADATDHPSFAKKIEGLWPPFMERSRLDKDVPTYSTSIDAALAMAERVLPGCCVLVGDYKGLANHTRWNGKGEVRATKGWCSLNPDDDACSNYRVHAHTPALALCAAILCAKASNPEGEA